MAVPNSTHRVDYNGDGSTTEFAVPFYFLANADVTVTHVSSAGTETVWTEGSEYTLAGAGDEDGGLLTASTAPSSGTRLVIRREVAQTQEIKYPANDPFPSSSHEQALDKLTMIAQEQQEQIDRSLKRPVGDPTDAEMTLPTKTDRASKVLAFDSDGRPVALSQLDKSVDTVTATGTDTARSLAEWMASVQVGFDSIEDLAADDDIPPVALVRGFYAPNDGGSGLFYHDPTSEETEIPGHVIKPDGVTGAGRYLRLTSGRQWHARHIGLKPGLEDATGAEHNTDTLNEVLGNLIADAVADGTKANEVILDAALYQLRGGWLRRRRGHQLQAARAWGRQAGHALETLDSTADVFQLTTSSGNIRDFVMTDLTLVLGQNGLKVSGAEYCTFERVSIWATENYGILIEGAGGRGMNYDSIWFVHLNGNALRCQAHASFNRCIFGEDSGTIEVTGDLRLYGCNGWGMTDKLRPLGFQDEGPTAFGLLSGGSLSIHGGHWSQANAADFIHIDSARRLLIDGTFISVPNGRKVIRNRFSQSGPEPYNGHRIINNYFLFSGDGEFYTQTAPASTRAWRNSIIANNVFDIPSGATVDFDDGFLTSTQNNFIDGNRVVEQRS